MSNSRNHKNKGKWNSGVLDKIPIDLQNMWDRSNNDLGEFRAKKKELEDKIAEKELKEEVRIIETGENIDFYISEQDEILEQIMVRVRLILIVI